MDYENLKERISNVLGIEILALYKENNKFLVYIKEQPLLKMIYVLRDHNIPFTLEMEIRKHNDTI